MKFKGLNFRKAKNVVVMPTHDKKGNLMPYVKAGKENYIHFGFAPTPTSKRNPFTPSKQWYTVPDYKWTIGTDSIVPKGRTHGGVFDVDATPIANKGWSLTNMMYGTDGRVYLLKDGVIYTANLPKENA